MAIRSLPVNALIRRGRRAPICRVSPLAELGRSKFRPASPLSPRSLARVRSNFVTCPRQVTKLERVRGIEPPS